MTALEIVRRHAEEFRVATGISPEIVEEPGGSRIFILLPKVPLPAGLFKVERTDVLFIGDTQYPHSALDMFWTEADVVRLNGSVPQGADQLETHLGRQWRRFSWHRNNVWNPASNGLLDHYAFMEAAWAALSKQ